MTNPFESAVSATLKGLRSIAAAPVRYTHGSQTVSCKAMQGGTQKQPIEVVGREAVVEVCDFLIAVEDLPFTPTNGDIIERDQSDRTLIWSVESRYTGEAPWDWSDTLKTQYRIRCRKDGDKAFEVTVASGFDLSGNEIKGQE